MKLLLVWVDRSLIHLSPSTRKRNAQRINQWKAKRNEAVGDSKTCAQTQTDDSNSITDETTQTEQLHSDEQAIHKPTTLTQIRERSTQTRSNFIGRQLTPTKYLDTEEPQTPWNNYGFSSLDPHQLHRYSVGINLQVPS
jgi:hypothetical protein